MDDEVVRIQARFIDLLNRRDWVGLGEMYQPDYVEDWLQSGERVRGLENFRRIMESYPGASAVDDEYVQSSVQVFPAPERWIVTPTFTTIRVSGSADRFTAVVRARYPDGSTWYIVGITELRDGLFARGWRFWAPVYPAPEWRAGWVEPLTTS